MKCSGSYPGHFIYDAKSAPLLPQTVRRFLLGLSILTLWKDISTILQSLEAPWGDIFIIFFNVYKNTTVSVRITVVF